MEEDPKKVIVEHVECLDGIVKWISPSHRVLFYRTCLGKKDIEKFKKKAKSSARKLEQLTFELMKIQKQRGATGIGSGSAMIVGGVLGGIGIVLAPFTSGASLALTLKVVASAGTALALGGSMGAVFGPDAKKTIQESQSQLRKLEKDSVDLASLLLMYTQSATFERKNGENGIINDISDRFIQDITEKTEQILLIVANIGKATLQAKQAKTLVNQANLAKLGKRYGENLASIAAGAHGSPAVTQLAGGQPVRISFESANLKNIAPLNIQQVWSKSSKLSKVAKVFLRRGGKMALGMGSRIVPFINIGFGIYEVLNGVKELNQGFYHTIKASARNILHDTDEILKAYTEIMGSEDVGTNSRTKELYAIDVLVTDGNWDYLSGAYLWFRNGRDPDCKTASISFSKGWYKLHSKVDLGTCQYYPIYDGNLSVALSSDQNSGLKDNVRLESIQVATDGNHLPTLETMEPLQAQSSLKTPYTQLRKITGLKQIKTHTSTLGKAGTDSYLKIRLNYENNTSTQLGLKDGVYLDNYGNDREQDQTDVYSGDDIKDVFYQKFLDVLEFPEFHEGTETVISAEFKLASFWLDWASAWHTDLLKLYFSGEQGTNIILTCNLNGGTWLKADGHWKKFVCKIYKPRNPATSMEMIKARFCDLNGASTSSTQVRFRICKQKSDFTRFIKSERADSCCKTNYFGLKDSSSGWTNVDTLLNDGGEMLGQCEGFEMSGTESYIAIENESSDEVCFNELQFFGDPTGNSSLKDIPFASCSLEPRELFKNKSRLSIGDDISRDWEDERSAIRCGPRYIPEVPLVSLEVGICNKYSGHSYDSLGLTICSKASRDHSFSDCCTTKPFHDIDRGESKILREDELGTCQEKKLRPFVSVKLRSFGSDATCVGFLKFNQGPAYYTTTWAESGRVWTYHRSQPVDIFAKPHTCKMTKGSTVKSLTVKVCDARRSGSIDKLVIHMMNGNGKDCKTNGLEGPRTNEYKEYSAGRLGPTCAGLEITDFTSMWLYTQPGRDALCLTDVFLEVSNSRGITRSVRCRFDPEKPLGQYDFQGGDHKRPNIPMICA